MKAAFLFLLSGLLLMASAARTQALRGTFGTPDSVKTFEHYFLRFEGSRFFYKLSGCTGTYEGSGTFRLARHYVHLNFEHSAADTAVAVRPGQPGDPTNTFRFRVRWQLGNGQDMEAMGATISSRKAHKSVATDKNGEAVLHYDAPAADTLVVTYVGAQPVYLPVKAGANQCFTIRLSEHYYFRAGEKLTLRVRKQTPQTMLLEASPDFADPELPVSRFRVYRLTDAEAAAFLRL